jgi:hypothetical protein
MINQYKDFGRRHCLHFRGTTLESVISPVIAKILGVLVPICVTECLLGTTSITTYALLNFEKRERVFQSNVPDFLKSTAFLAGSQAKHVCPSGTRST